MKVHLCKRRRTLGCLHLQYRRARTSPCSANTLQVPSFIQRGARLQLLLEVATYPAFEAVAGARGAQEVLEVQGAVGHKIVVADGGVVEDGQLDLMAIGNRGRELLVVGGLVGLLLGAGLPDAHLVHADGDIGVQELVALAEQRVPEGPAGGLQTHRLPDPHLQVPVELHSSGHGRPAGSPAESQTPLPRSRAGRQPRRVSSGGRAAAAHPPPGHAGAPEPPPPAHRPPPAAPGSRSAAQPRRSARPGPLLPWGSGAARDTWGVGRRRAGRRCQPALRGRARGGERAGRALVRHGTARPGLGESPRR